MSCLPDGSSSKLCGFTFTAKDASIPNAAVLNFDVSPGVRLYASAFDPSALDNIEVKDGVDLSCSPNVDFREGNIELLPNGVFLD